MPNFSELHGNFLNLMEQTNNIPSYKKNCIEQEAK
tara:strand:+ start:399 stop:503 length:105 start_codon:yes stop_codon:yes gene_type:complete